MIIIVMGVSGCGKSTVGRALASHLGADYLEGDDLHPPHNIAKMTSGVALVDDDRLPWLQLLKDAIADADARGQELVIACSALTRAYRDELRKAAPLRFVYLAGTHELIRERVTSRSGHFMPPALLESQLDTLEPPESEPATLTLDADQPVSDLVDAAAAWVGAS